MHNNISIQTGKNIMFTSLGKNSNLFNHSDDEAIHLALASVLYHFIHVDHTASSNEIEKFSSILQQEFDLDDEQVEHLYQSAKVSTSEFLSDLKIIDHYLKSNPMIRMEFMNKLNALIRIDGVQDCEMNTFNEALHTIFPGIKSV